MIHIASCVLLAFLLNFTLLVAPSWGQGQFDNLKVQPIRHAPPQPTTQETVPLRPLQAATTVQAHRNTEINPVANDHRNDSYVSLAGQNVETRPGPVALSKLADRQDRQQNHWLRSSEHLTPLNLIANRPEDLFDNDADSSPVIILLWQPQLDREILSLDQVKQLANGVTERRPNLPSNASESLTPRRMSPQDQLGATRIPTGDHPAPTRDLNVAPTSFLNTINGLQEPDSKKPQEGDLQGKQDKDQEGKPQEAVKPVTAQAIDDLQTQIDARRKQTAANEALDEAAKTDAMNILNTASDWLQKARQSETYLRTETEARDKFKETLDELQQALKTDIDTGKPAAEAKLDELNAQLQLKEAELDTLINLQQTTRNKLAEQEKRTPQLPSLRKAAEDAIKKVIESLDAMEKQPDDFNKPLSMLVLRAKRLSLELEAKALALEAQRQQQLARSLPLEREQNERKIKSLRAEIDNWRTTIDTRREREIQRQRQEAQRAAVEAAKLSNPRLQAIAKRNQEVTAMRSELTQATMELREELEKLKSQNKSIESDKQTLEERIDTVGLTHSTGMLLVEHRRSLASTAKSKHRLIELAEDLRTSQTRILGLKEELATANQRKGNIDELLDPKKMSDEDASLLAKEATDLVESQIFVINDLLGDYSQYRKMLFDVEVEHRSLIANVNESREFSDENALWVRSAKPLRFNDLTESSKGLTSFFNGAAWGKLASVVGSHITNQPYETGLLGLLIGSLWVVQRRLRWSHE